MPKQVLGPTTQVDDFHLLEIASSEEEEEDDDLGLNYESIKAGMSEEYTGQVKSLVRMYETFAKNIHDGREGRGNNTRSSDIIVTKPGETIKLSPMKTSDNTPKHALASAKHSSEACLPHSAQGKVPSLTDLRLSHLETKVGALVDFVGELIPSNIDILGSHYLHQVNAEKNIDVLKTTVKSIDDELDEVHEQLEDVETGVSSLKKDNKTMKLRVKQLEQMMLSGNSDLQLVIKDVSKNVASLSKMVDRITGTLDRLVDMVPKIKDKIGNGKTIGSSSEEEEKEVPKAEAQEVVKTQE